MKKLPFYLLIISNFLVSKDIIINSKILNNHNKPLHKANVSCDDKFTISDINGDFTIKCKESSNINITYIGYNKYKINTKNIGNIINLEAIEILTKEVKVYGGLKSTSSDTRIKIIDKNDFNLNGKDSFQDIIQSTPELNFAGGTANLRYIQIRGLGELSQFSGEGAPHFYVGVFLDDINFTGVGGITLLDDIKQIEIFKGPQSTAFGENAMAGAINMISSSPSFEKTFTTKISYGSFNTHKYSFNLNYPLTKKLSSNISLVKNDSGGYIKNRYLPDENSNAKDELLTKIKLLYSPNKLSKYLLTYYYIVLDNKYDAWTVDNNGYNTLSDFQGVDKNKTKAFSLKALFDVNKLKIISITSYSNNNIDYAYDGDWGNEEMWELEPYNWDEDEAGYAWNFPDITTRKRELVSHELRFSFKNILFGIYTSKLEEKDDRTGYFFNANHGDNMISIFNIQNHSFYAKYNHILSTKISINYSFRYDNHQTENNLYYTEYWVNHVYEKLTNNDNNIGWNMLLTNTLNPNSNIFFSLSRGYKTAGINQSPNFSDNRFYNSENSLNTEIGYYVSKNNISLKSSIFYMHREDPQLRLFSQQNIDYPTYFDYSTINGSTSYTYGLEYDLHYQISDKYIFYSSLLLLNNHLGVFYFDEIINNGVIEKFGNRDASHSPNSKVTLGGEIQLSSNLNFNINTNYVDEYYFDEQNDHKSKGYTLVNGSLVFNKNKLSLSIWGKNLTNEKYAIRGYSFVLIPDTTTGYDSDEPQNNKTDYRSYGEKQSFGITFQYSL